MRLRLSGAVVVAACLVLVGCAPTQEDAASSPTGAGTVPAVQESTQLVKASEPSSVTGGTLLEGPTFHEGGDLFVVDVMAAPGESKIMRIDVEDGEVSDVFTDDTSAFTSAQFNPVDGRLYLTDIVGGTIVSITEAGEGLRTHLAGDVDGAPMLPDDIAFAEDGTMFVSDTTGMDGPGWNSEGRIIRVGVDGSSSVIAENQPSPNGIVFDEDEAGLWVAQYNANRIDYLGLDDTRTHVISAYPAIYVDGGISRVDSTAVDADGNIYQAFHGKPEVVVFSKFGDRIGTVRVPGGGLESATNIAISPGTTDGYLVVSGPAGGFVRTFTAFGEGIRQSNGG